MEDMEDMEDIDEMTRSEFVKALSPELDNDERHRLQSLAHDLHPVVLVGQHGISDGLLENFDNQILAHELIKVKVHDADSVRPMAKKLHEESGAQLAQILGNVLLFYRPHPEEPEVLT